MVYYAVGLSYFASSYEGVLDDGSPYDYDESRWIDHFSNIVHATDQPLWEEERVVFGWVFAQMVLHCTVNMAILIHVGVRTYDHATDWALIMRAALMWTVNDLPAYRMAFGWSTAGVMGYPICMNDTRAFYLQHGRKACYFDCHRQFLSAHHSYRRNKKAFTKNCFENKVARPRLT
ncbi:UNVERIFIED_CONTAM: hypothetical protein Sradi_5883700 [Sesamum radiatum]|uniref:Uncharacterized protein n=1 Tax=Sesamum radiatum TaxID=300843 RepID=A0AAW2KSV9_SESRA